MNKEELYKQIREFNNQLTNPSDRSSKNYEKAYLYVSDENAIDKAEFIKFLIENKHLNKFYNGVLDLTFGSGNLTSHIIFDNDIEYDFLIFNDINRKNTNQKIVKEIINSHIMSINMLESENFNIAYESAELVIVNPQIGGNYIKGNIYHLKDDNQSQQDVLNQLGTTLMTLIRNGGTIIFYGQEKDFKSVLPTNKFIKYKSELTDCFVVKANLEENLCFEKSNNDFISCIDRADNEEMIESFDNIEVNIDTFDEEGEKKTNEEKTMKVEEKREIFSKIPHGKPFPHKNLLLKGVPGTGKSKTIENIINDDLGLGDKPQNICRINIHSASSNADLMQGIGINSNDGNIEYKEKQGLIYNHIKKALFAPKQPFVLVLEEIQENSLNELIGDLIYLIEETKRVTVDDSRFEEGEAYEYQKFIEIVLEDKANKHTIEIPYLVDTSTAYRKMVLPSNLYLFCTSNYRDDKKVIEDNLLRRFDVVEIYPQTQESLGADVFKSEDISNFLEFLNSAILEKFTAEIHPDRYLVGHANWLNITDEENDSNKKLFFTALLKVIIEFKEIREVDFDTYTKEILEAVLKDENLSGRIKAYIAHCDFRYNSYKEMVEKLQKEIYSFVK